MCGRTAQTQNAVMTAASLLQSTHRFSGNLVDKIGRRASGGGGNTDSTSGDATSTPSGNKHDNESPEDTTQKARPGGVESEIEENDEEYPWRDNFNLSPGHDAVVFTLNKNGELQMDRKIWGLVPKDGTPSAPLPRGPSKHFANLMFNARSDTLFSKPTFAKLLREGKSCIAVFDGFFEWKADALGGGKGKKQPYFVFRKNDNDNTGQSRPLIMAGLWTSVKTGWEQPTTLDTFTLLTTEVCGPLKWLHTRMPVCIWDEDLALEWLKNPSPKVHQQIDLGAHKTLEGMFAWHAVTTQMSSTKFRSAESIKPMPQPKTVKSFFAPINKKNTTTKPGDSTNAKPVDEKTASYNSSPVSSTKIAKSSPIPASVTKKRPAPAEISNPGPPKKGTITSFFSPKKEKR